MTAKHAWLLLKKSFSEWSEDNVSRLAAALAYYTIFSLAPLLVIIISVVGMVFGQTKAKEEVARQVEGLVGKQGGEMIGTMVENAGKTGSGWAMFLGIALLVYGATNVFASLQDSLNTIWEIKPKPGLGIWQTVRNRLLSFAMVLGVAFLLMVSLVISTALSVVTKYFGGQFPSVFWQVAELVVSLGIFTVIFAAIYKILPDVKIQWRTVWVGGALTAVLFAIGKFLISLYLGRSSATSVYGAAGSLVIVLLWIYYASQILFFGAEFTQVYARYEHHPIQAEDYAVKLTEAERVKQGMPHKETVEEAVDVAEGRRDVRPEPPRISPAVTYVAAAAGLLAGFVAGGTSKVIKSRDRAVREAVAHRMHERIRLLHARVKQGERVGSYLREADVQDRLDWIERRVRRINEGVR